MEWQEQKGVGKTKRRKKTKKRVCQKSRKGNGL